MITRDANKVKNKKTSNHKRSFFKSWLTDYYCLSASREQRTSRMSSLNMLRAASIRIIFLAWALNSVSAFASPSAVRSVARLSHYSQPSYHVIQNNARHAPSSSVRMALALPRGGGGIANFASSPQSLFNFTLLSLALTTVLVKLLQKATAPMISEQDKVSKPASIRALQTKFLPVFWLLRCADWLQGPYFYEGTCVLLSFLSFRLSYN